METSKEVLKNKIELEEKNIELLKERIVKYQNVIPELDNFIEHNIQEINIITSHFEKLDSMSFTGKIYGYGLKPEDSQLEIKDETRIDKKPIQIKILLKKEMGAWIQTINNHTTNLKRTKTRFTEKVGAHKAELNNAKENLKKLKEELAKADTEIINKENEKTNEMKEESPKNDESGPSEKADQVTEKQKKKSNKGISKRIDELIDEFDLINSEKYTDEICNDVCKILKDEGFDPNRRSVYSILNKRGINNQRKKIKKVQ